ncbi:TPA: hypothetical protein ACVU5P_004191 [Vibrio parahaemolyticus]
MNDKLQALLTTEELNRIEFEVSPFNENFYEIATDRCCALLSVCKDPLFNCENENFDRTKVLDFVKYYFGYSESC